MVINPSFYSTLLLGSSVNPSEKDPPPNKKGNFPFFDRLDQIVKHRATNNSHIRRKICNDKFLNAMNMMYIRSKLYNE